MIDLNFQTNWSINQLHDEVNLNIKVDQSINFFYVNWMVYIYIIILILFYSFCLVSVQCVSDLVPSCHIEWDNGLKKGQSYLIGQPWFQCINNQIVWTLYAKPTRVQRTSCEQPKTNTHFKCSNSANHHNLCVHNVQDLSVLHLDHVLVLNILTLITCFISCEMQASPKN